MAAAIAAATKTDFAASLRSSPPAGWLSISKAAMLLGRSQRSIQAACQAGRMKAVRTDGDMPAWYIDPDCRPEFRISRGDVAQKPAPADSVLAGLTEAKRQAVYERHLLVQAFIDAAAQRPKGMGLCEFRKIWVSGWNGRNAEKMRTSVGTLRRLARAYKEEGIAGLVDERHSSRDQAASPEALEFMIGLWLQEERPTVSRIYEQAQAMAPVFGWTLPSYGHAARILKRRVSPAQKALGREPRRYRDRLDLLVSRDWSRVSAMELWVADHRQLDIWVPRQSEAGNWSWGRVWLTAFIDARSWYPVAWTLAWDAPNANRVLGTFLRAVREHGQPEWVYLDNGKDFRADRIAGGRPSPKNQGAGDGGLISDPDQRVRAESILGRLGIQAIFAIPYNARAKVIENWFRAAVAERFDKCWATYCSPTTEDRPERLRGLDPADLAAKGLTLEAVKEAFGRWINEDYALLECPVKASKGYSTLRAFRHLRNPEFVERRPPDQTLAFLLLPTKALTVGQQGIKISEFNMTYWAPELEDLRGASGHDDARKVLVRYDPGDPSKIYVFLRHGEFKAVALPYIGAGIHPLARAGSQADRDRLSDAMALKGEVRKRDKADVAYYREVAQQFAPILEREMQARSTLGLHEDPAAIPLAPTPAVLAIGEADRAAAAGVKAQREIEDEVATQTMAQRVAVGLESRAARTDARGRVPTALELVALKTARQFKKESEDERPESA